MIRPANDWPHYPTFPPSVDLDPLGHLPGHTHLFESREVWAIRAALGARRPLLLRGKPGTGKSELARAAAAVLHRPLVGEVISARTESADLLYRFDAVARLGQAQLLGVAHADRQGSDLATLSEERFLSPGPLWWVFDWTSAEGQHVLARSKGRRPQAPPSWKDGKDAEVIWSPDMGTVLLIDEIDKADPDLPNGLLEALGDGEFAVPYREMPVTAVGREPPLVVITTNEERELPAAFVRRCLVLELKLPEGTELEVRLQALGRAHFGDRIADKVYEDAAKLVVEDRKGTRDDALVRPGQAEYLDLLRAVLDVTDREVQAGRKANDERFALQSAVLTELQGFVLRKNASD